MSINLGHVKKNPSDLDLDLGVVVGMRVESGVHVLMGSDTRCVTVYYLMSGENEFSLEFFLVTVTTNFGENGQRSRRTK